ncbi:MAG: translocation/assembly module TamB domain-containing protein [Myxococcota bacterium]
MSGNASEAGLLDSRFMAHLSLPRGRRPFTATLDELRMHRAPVAGGRRDPTDLVVITGARLDETGWIDFGTIHVGTSATGSLSLSGRLQAKDGELDLTASGKDIRLDDWLGHVRRLTRLPLDNLPDADGVVSFEIVATGTAAEPRVRAEVHLRDARFDQRQGGAVDLDAALSGSAFKGTYAVRWSAEGHAEGSFDLPVDVSFDPFRARFDETAPVAFELAAAVPDLRDALAWGEAVVGHALLPGFSGKTTVTASLGGTGLAPKVSLRAAPLAIAQAPGTTPTARCKKGCDWKGAIALEGNTDPHDPRHWRIGLTVDEGVVAKAPPAPKPGTVAAPAAVDPNAPSPASGMVPGAPPPGVAPTATTPVVNAADADADENRLLRLEADVPTTVFAAIWSSDPGAVERILAAEDLGLALNMPERALGDLPGVALIEDFAYRGVHVRANLRFNGRYPKLVADGLVRLTELGDLGLSGGLEARFTSDGDKLIVMVDASASELSLASGQITIPKFGTLLTAPGRFRDLLEEPDFKIQLDTMALPTADLINLDPSLGQTLEMLFPYSTASAHVTAHGERGGPEANIVLAIFATGSDASSNDPSAAATASAATALAEQTYVTLKVRRVETELDAILVGDTRRGTGLSLTARADVGTTALLQGKVENWGRIPITATLVADTFRLEGLMSAFQEILGGTAGFMTGTLDIDGTLGEPRFNGTPGIVLEPLSVPKIGFEQPASLYIAFEGSSIRLQDPLVFEVPAKKGDEAQTMQLDFHADVPNFDPKRITLDGSLTLLRYPVLATQDMQVRATGRATLTGTAARPVIEGKIAVVDGVVAPDIAQRDVRALGLPADVHFVRGEAKPPPDVAKRVTSRKTAMQIDLAIDIPKSSVRVEPHIVQPIGEVRALLWPYGSLQIRTVQREIGIFGTIYVPKENVYLYGKKFVVDPDSRVVFTGDMETDPQLFLTARYDISHVDLTSIGLSTTAESEVVVRVSGSPSTNLRIDFASDPPMDEANILSVIALDQPAGGGQGITDAVTTQIAGAVLGMATLELTRDLVKKLPIDILRIESTSASLESAKVTVGKILAQDLTWYNFFNVNAREGESVYESSLEYRLNRYFSLIAKWGDIGELSLETSLRFQP